MLNKKHIIILLMILAIYPVYWISIVIHELGHYIAFYVSGGYVVDFVVTWYNGHTLGYAPTDTIVFVHLLGGVFQAFFFVLLSERLKTKYLFAPAVFCLTYAIFEAMQITFAQIISAYFVLFAYLIVATGIVINKSLDILYEDEIDER